MDHLMIVMAAGKSFIVSSDYRGCQVETPAALSDSCWWPAGKMKTLLVLAPHPELAETIRSGLSPEQYRVIHRTTVEEAEPILAHGLASACILDVELSAVQGVWVLEKLRRRSPRCPLIIFTSAKQWEWEEEAYLQGASHVLTKPVRIRMLTSLLDRLWETIGSPVPPQLSSPVPDYPKVAA